MRNHNFSIIDNLDKYLREKGDRGLLEITTEVIEERKAGILPIPIPDRRKDKTKIVKVIKGIKVRNCGRCSKELPWTRDYFYFTKKKLGNLSTICKNCDKSRNKIYRDKIKEAA